MADKAPWWHLRNHANRGKLHVMRKKPRGPRTRQVQLRAPESFRLRLEAAAKRNNVSLNREMLNRLASTFEQGTARSFDEIRGEMDKAWRRHWGAALHELNKQGDLIRATERLLAAIESDDANAKTAAIADVHKAIRVIELSAAKMVREAHTV
jgi:hypothetical protein